MLSKKNGFTFIEVVAAIFVITLVVVSVFALIQNVMIQRHFAVSQLQAAYLAQEGAELARNQRDSNFLGPEAWDHDLASSTFTVIRTPLNQKFTRELNATPTFDGTVEVEVIVRWSRGLNNYNFTLLTELANWYDP